MYFRTNQIPHKINGCFGGNTNKMSYIHCWNYSSGGIRALEPEHYIGINTDNRYFLCLDKEGITFEVLSDFLKFSKINIKS